MGKNNSKKKGIQTSATSKPTNGVSKSTSNNKEELKSSQKVTLRKDNLGLALLILVTLGFIVLLYLQPWNASGRGTMRYNSDYVLCYNSSKYNVHAGDTVNIINDNLIIIAGDTVCIPDSLDIFIDNNEFEPKQVKIIDNENGAARIYEYTSAMAAKNKQLLDISNDSVPLKAVEGEMFEISQEKDKTHDRPLLVLGTHVIWPNYGTTEPRDTLGLAGHEPILPSIFKVFGDTLVVKFERTQSIYNVGIYPEYSNKLIANVGTDGKESKVYIGDIESFPIFRLCTKNHISCLIQPTEAEIIEIPNPVTNDNSQFYLLMIISIIAFVEFIIISVAVTLYFVKRRRNNSMANDIINENNDKKQDIESPQIIEQPKAQIVEKGRVLPEKKMQSKKRIVANNQNKTRVSVMDDHENRFTGYGKRPETDNDKFEWIESLLNSSEYKDEEFVKQLNYENEKLDKSVFRKIALSEFDELYSQWIDLLKRQNEKIEDTNIDGSEQNNDAKDLLEQKIQAEEANQEQLRKQLEDQNATEDIKSKDSIKELQTELNKKTKEVQTLTGLLEKAEKEKEEAELQGENKIKQAVIDTEERVTKKYEGTIASMETDIQEKLVEIQALSKELSTTCETLKTTKEELLVANNTIDAKEKALDRFNKTITDIAPAKEYADSLEQLLLIGEKVEKAAIELGQNRDVDDYLINKYIARYRAALSVIDMQMFITDVLNATRAQFVYKGQMLATFDQKDKNTFYESMKLYFYDTYLKKYVDALVVLNETMVGMQYLADGVTPGNVKPFEIYRKEIDATLKAIEIDVISVKIMDSCADNLSLTVIPKVLDFDCPKNSICQIDNCIVYLKGASKPNEKIKVVVKK